MYFWLTSYQIYKVVWINPKPNNAYMDKLSSYLNVLVIKITVQTTIIIIINRVSCVYSFSIDRLGKLTDPFLDMAL